MKTHHSNSLGVVFLLIVLCVGGCPSHHQSLSLLSNAPVFVTGVDGQLGAPDAYATMYWDAFKELSNSNEARHHFKTLYSSPNPHASLYGLCGLFLYDRVAYEYALEEALKNNSVVNALEGNIVISRKYSEIVFHSDDAKIYRKLSWTYRDFLKENPSFSSDISSGLLPFGMIDEFHVFDMSLLFDENNESDSNGDSGLFD